MATIGLGTSQAAAVDLTARVREQQYVLRRMTMLNGWVSVNELEPHASKSKLFPSTSMTNLSLELSLQMKALVSSVRSLQAESARTPRMQSPRRVRKSSRVTSRVILLVARTFG
jgi:hypothetical protein